MRCRGLALGAGPSKGVRPGTLGGSTVHLVSTRIHLNRLEEWPQAKRLRGRLRRAVMETLAASGMPPEGELCVTLLPEEEIRLLNRKYAGRDAVTDVLAFDLSSEGELLGDIYVAPDVARRSAAERGLDASDELLRLVIHGVLHLVGYDHPEGEERYGSPMFELQEELLRRVRGSRRSLKNPG